MFSHLSQEQGKSVCSLHFPSNIVLEVLASAIKQEGKIMQIEEQEGETPLFMDNLSSTGAGAIQCRSNSLSNKSDIHKQMKGKKRRRRRTWIYTSYYIQKLTQSDWIIDLNVKLEPYKHSGEPLWIQTKQRSPTFHAESIIPKKKKKKKRMGKLKFIKTF